MDQINDGGTYVMDTQQNLDKDSQLRSKLEKLPSELPDKDSSNEESNYLLNSR